MTMERISRTDAIKNAANGWEKLAEPYDAFDAGDDYAIVRLVSQPLKPKKKKPVLAGVAPKELLVPDGKGDWSTAENSQKYSHKALPLVVVLRSEDSLEKREQKGSRLTGPIKSPGTVWTVPAGEVTGVMINPKWEHLKLTELKAEGGLSREASEEDMTEKYVLNLDQYWGRYLFALPWNEELTSEDKFTFRVPLLKLQSPVDISKL